MSLAACLPLHATHIHLNIFPRSATFYSLQANLPPAEEIKQVLLVTEGELIGCCYRMDCWRATTTVFIGPNLVHDRRYFSTGGDKNQPELASPGWDRTGGLSSHVFIFRFC